MVTELQRQMLHRIAAKDGHLWFHSLKAEMEFPLELAGSFMAALCDLEDAGLIEKRENRAFVRWEREIDRLFITSAGHAELESTLSR
jgi:hypothetical protein